MFHVEVSRRIREEFSNGREYYSLHGKKLVSIPIKSATGRILYFWSDLVAAPWLSFVPHDLPPRQAVDLGQRIVQQPFSWTQVGVDIRGSSRTLRINYRTSHQIRSQADQRLDPESRDVDGNVQDRRGAISVFNGPEPDIRECEDSGSETEQVAAWIEQRRSEGLTPREFGIFVRSEAEITRAEAALQLAELPYERLRLSAIRLGSKATLSTMHLAKGLEFRAVIVMACDEDIIPNAERIKAITDDSDLDEVVVTERHLLYVACTRARDHLLITSGDTCSEFVEDLRG
jgi:superfamily I DNA/RNA helicase